MNLRKHPEFVREYDPQADVWYARTNVESHEVTNTDLESLVDDFSQGFTRYYSLKVLSEARQTGSKVTLVFKGQDDDPCAVLPYRTEPPMFSEFMAKHNANLQSLIGSVLDHMNRPNP